MRAPVLSFFTGFSEVVSSRKNYVDEDYLIADIAGIESLQPDGLLRASRPFAKPPEWEILDK